MLSQLCFHTFPCPAATAIASCLVLQLRSIGMVGYVLGPFIFAACMFGMVMQVRSDSTAGCGGTVSDSHGPLMPHNAASAAKHCRQAPAGLGVLARGLLLSECAGEPARQGTDSGVACCDAALLRLLLHPLHPLLLLVVPLGPQLGAVVGEKEAGLVTALRLMGLRQSAYWTSWVAADLLLGLATAFSIVIWGEARPSQKQGAADGVCGVARGSLTCCWGWLRLSASSFGLSQHEGGGVQWHLAGDLGGGSVHIWWARGMQRQLLPVVMMCAARLG